MNWDNTLTRLLQIKFPIIQAPMLSVTSPQMVGAAANFGVLGSLPLGGLPPEKCKELIQQTRQLTNQPFAVNLFAHSLPETNTNEISKMQQLLEQIASEFNIKIEKEEIDKSDFYTAEDQIEVILEQKIPIVSFTFGVLSDNSIEKLKSEGVILIGTCTSVEEGVFLAKKGIDVICAQGYEAGGHRGSFIFDKGLPKVGTFSLVPQLFDAVQQPIIAAGGIYNGRTTKAAMTLGASAVQIGSCLVASDESLATLAYKNELKHASNNTTVTRSFSGRWARGINNSFIDKIEHSGLNIPDYPIQNKLTAKLRQLAKQKDETALMSLWAGQSASNAQQKSTAQILEELVTAIETI
ncbi:MAG: nitronate monooxygenase [Chitinophagales bacterium]